MIKPNAERGWTKEQLSQIRELQLRGFSSGKVPLETPPQMRPSVAEFLLVMELLEFYGYEIFVNSHGAILSQKD